MWCKVNLTSEFKGEILKCDIQMKDTERYFPLVGKVLKDVIELVMDFAYGSGHELAKKELDQYFPSTDRIS